MRRNGMSIMQVFCKKPASVRMYSGKQVYRYTLQTSRGPNAFPPRMWASWSATPCCALNKNQRKSWHLLETSSLGHGFQPIQRCLMSLPTCSGRYDHVHRKCAIRVHTVCGITLMTITNPRSTMIHTNITQQDIAKH